MIYDIFLIISRYNTYVMDPSFLSTCSTCCFILWILFWGVSTCHFIVRRLFSVHFWALVRGHHVQIIVLQGVWHLQFIDPQGGCTPPFYTIKWLVGPPPWKVTSIFIHIIPTCTSDFRSGRINYISLLANNQWTRFGFKFPIQPESTVITWERSNNPHIYDHFHVTKQFCPTSNPQSFSGFLRLVNYHNNL